MWLSRGEDTLRVILVSQHHDDPHVPNDLHAPDRDGGYRSQYPLASDSLVLKNLDTGA